MGSQRKQTKEWEPWYTFLDNGGKIACQFCNGTFSYKRERAFAHFGYRAKSEKAICLKLPQAVRHRFANCGGLIPQRMSHEEMYAGSSFQGGSSRGVAVAGSSQSDAQNEGTGGVRSEGLVEGANLSDVPDPSERSDGLGASNSTRSGPLRQQRMVDAFNYAKRKELDEKWATFFYQANVPFNVARNPAFMEAVRATSVARFEYNPPSYHQLRTNLIEPKRLQIEREIEAKVGFAVKNYGVTICTDGWDDVNRRPLMNVMMSCPTGDVFMGSIDTTGQQKSMRYIADQLKVFIDKVGPKYVTQVCTDNAANMLGAVNDIILTYPHIFKQGCMAHALDLLLEDWAKVQEFKDLIERSKKLCQYIRNHHATMSAFRELSPNLQLVVPSETRFACNFLMLHRLVKLKDVLERLKDHPRVLNYFNTLRNRQNGEQAATASRNVVRTIQDVAFWQRCVNFVHMTEDVLKALRVFDGREPAMGRAWLVMHNLRQHVHSLREPPFSLPDHIATVLEESFQTRWDMVFTDVHYAAALLNPYLRDNVPLRANGMSLRALYRVIRKMADNVGVNFDDVLAELTQYEEQTGPYSPDETPNFRLTQMLPHQWWHRVGDHALSKIAVRILALTCSASSCERNWSMYSFVHNKSRNRLAPDKAESLVYIYTNSRVLHQRPGADPVRWYDANILSEDSDPDALGPVPVGERNREFDEMRAEEEEEDDMEANRAPREYRRNPNPDIWREGADHLEETRNYYGDDDGLEEENLVGGRWSPLRRSPPRIPSPPRPQNEGIAEVHSLSSSSGSENARAINLDDQEIPSNDDNDDNPSSGNGGGNGDDHNNTGGENVGNTATPNCEGSVDDRDGNRGAGGVGASHRTNRLFQGYHGRNIGNTTTVQPVAGIQTVVNVARRFDPDHIDPDDVFAFRDDVVNEPAPAQIAVHTVILDQATPTPSSLNPSSSTTSNAINRPIQGGLGFVGNDEETCPNASNATTGGRPPTAPRPPLHYPMGQYQQGRGRIGGSAGTRGRGGIGGRVVALGRGGIGGSGGTRGRGGGRGRGGIGGNISSGGRNNGEASSSRPTKRPLIGIGVRDPNVVIEPFLQTYVPGHTSSTPAFVVPRVGGGTVGPTINSDAEDPTAHRHKRLRRSRYNGETNVELRNENSEVENYWTSDGSDREHEHGNSEGADDDDVPVRDEAPEDDDVVIREANSTGTSNQEVRRSSRLNN